MLAYVLKNTSRAALVAYGVWALLSLALSAGTLTSLHQVEQTGREAVLARAEAGATAVELTLQRVFEPLRTCKPWHRPGCASSTPPTWPASRRSTRN